MNESKIAALLLEPIDLYCERTDAAWQSEPLNAVSNLSFIIASWAIFRLRRSLLSPGHRRELACLGWLAFSVGIGSGLFHTWANRVTQIADVAPIAIFVFTSLFFYFRNLHREGKDLRKPLGYSAIALTLPVLIAKLSGLADHLAKGESYLGIAPTLLVLAAFEDLRERRNRLALAAGLFVLAYVFRTMDGPICDIFPSGTHFLWHLTTTLSAYLMASTQAVTGRKWQDTRGG